MTEHQQNSESERTWLLAVYNSAIGDVRWAKEQSWRVVQWSFAFFGGTVALYRYPFEKLGQWWVFVVVAGVFGLATGYYVCDLHAFAKKSRDRLDNVKNTAPKRVRDILGERAAGDPHHVRYLLAQLGLITPAFAATWLGLYWIFRGWAPAGS